MQLNVQLVAALAIVLGVFCPFACGWRSFAIAYNSFPYEFNPDYLDGKMQILNTTSQSSVDVVINFKQDLDNLILKGAVAIQAADGNYTILINRTIHFCEFLKSQASEPFLKLIFEDVYKHGLQFNECPLKKGTYTLRDYRFDEELLPAYLPETRFFIDINLETQKHDFILKWRLYGKVDKSKGLNNLKMFSIG